VRGRINAIIEDREHRIWVARSRPPDSSGGLCQVDGEQPRCVGGDDRMRLPYAGPLSEDARGNLWIGASNQLMRWHDGIFKTYFREQLERYQGLASVEGVAAAPDGSVWVAIPREGAISLFGLGRPTMACAGLLASAWIASGARTASPATW
jgi:ligand-binding sensor domain-containing protein